MLAYTCPCCGFKTLETDGSYDICPICFWEDDPYQKEHAYEDGGANTVSLIRAQKNYKDFGACEKSVLQYTRKPNASDKKDSVWKPIKDDVYEIKLICTNYKENEISLKELEEKLTGCDVCVHYAAAVDEARQEIEMIRFTTAYFRQREEAVLVLNHLLAVLTECEKEKG